MRNKILIFGDSITYGAWDLELGGWVNRVRLSIDKDRKIRSCHVFNLGISGQVTGEILERMDPECRSRIREDANTIIVIAAGINDSRLEKGVIRVPAPEFRKNYLRLIETARRYTDNVICVGLTPVDESRTNPVWWDRTMCWKNSLADEYDSMIREICSLKGTEYVDVHDLVDPLTNHDGLHPDAGGHKRIALAVRAALNRYIRR